MNREFNSNEALFKAIRALQNGLMVGGNENAARQIAEGLSCLNGLTDGWGQLMEVLEKAKHEYGSEFSKAQEKDFEDIVSCVKQVVYRG